MGRTVTPSFLIVAGLVAAGTYVFALLTETELAGGAFPGRVVELLMLGVPAVGLVYAGYWLRDADFDPDRVWRIGRFAVGGATVAAAATAVLLATAVPAVDGRSTFVLLVSTTTEGGLLGVLVGTFAVTDRLFRRERATADEYEMLIALLRHNVRNRLTVIGGHLKRLTEALESPDVEAVATIEGQLAAIESLLEDTRLATEVVGEPASPEPVDLVRVVREQVRLIEEGHDDLSVAVDLPDRAPVLAGDLLAAVVENLLSNAVVHHDRPDPQVGVTVTVDDRVRLAVVDDGPGVPPDRREAVFEPGTGAGTGMGLYLAETLVGRYDGSIAIGDNEPRGTVVTVTLPRADEPGR